MAKAIFDWVPEDLVQPVGIGRAEEQPARLAEDAAEMLAAEADGRRIDQRHHAFQVALQQRVEQRLVGVLKLAQEGVAFEVGGEFLKGAHAPAHLAVQRADIGRQQAVQAERVALVLGERGALVEQRVHQKFVARARRDELALAAGRFHALHAPLRARCGPA